MLEFLARRAPFEDVVAKIDACVAMPAADATYRPSLEHYRVTAYSTHGRPVDECVAVIDAYLALQPSLPARASAVLAACGERPEFAPRYLDAMIDELERAARASPADQVVENTLQGAYRVRQRIRGERPHAIAERVLSVADAPGRIVSVTIYTPTLDPTSPHGDWRREYRLHGALDVTDAGYGVDALQALIHAIQAARKALDGAGLALTWMGGEAGDHGIPAIVPQMFGRAFARSIEEDIERRLDAHEP